MNVLWLSRRKQDGRFCSDYGRRGNSNESIGCQLGRADTALLGYGGEGTAGNLWPR